MSNRLQHPLSSIDEPSSPHSHSSSPSPAPHSPHPAPQSPHPAPHSPLSPADEEKRRIAVRQNYASHLLETIEAKQQLCDPRGSQDLFENLARGDALFDGVTHARESAMDSLWLAVSSSYSLEMCRKLTVGKEMDPHLFLENIKTRFAATRWQHLNEEGSRQQQQQQLNNDESRQQQQHNDESVVDWKALGKHVARFFYRRVPKGLTFMNGPIYSERKHKERKKGVRKLISGGTAEEVEQLTETESDNSVTTKRVEDMRRRLVAREKVQPSVSYESMVVDPTSFTRTIENMFHASFLVHQGFTQLERQGERLIVKSCQNSQDQSNSHKLCVLKLDLAQWKRLAQRVEAPQSQLENGKRVRDDSEEEEQDEEDEEDGEMEHPPASKRAK